MPETVPGYYVWEVPGKAVTVQLNLEMIDRLSTVVMTGFGAIPRRGAEVGGILVGSINGSIVRIDEFEAVPCSYKRGPSYLLTEGDEAAFDEAWQKWKPEPGKAQYAVGYYRSNTRDKAELGEDDFKLCDKYFPPPSNVVLFIKPYASKVSQAGFLTYSDGKLDSEAALEFPFRRYEIEGTAPPSRRPLGEARPGSRAERGTPASRMAPEVEGGNLPARTEPESRGLRVEHRQEPAPAFQRSPAMEQPPSYSQVPAPELERPYAVTADSRARRKGWMWIPLSFIFLLLGVMLGFQAALTMYPKTGATASPEGDLYSIGLTVSKAEEHLHVKWDRQAAPVRAAARGLLFIKDGEFSKQVELDATQLQSGSVIYRRQSDRVTLRMEVYPKGRVVISESVDWRQ